MLWRGPAAWTRAILAWLLVGGLAAPIARADDWGRRDPEERHGFVNVRVITGGWGIQRNYLGSDGYYLAGLGVDLDHEVVVARDGQRARSFLFDLGAGARGVFGTPGPIFGVHGEVSLGLRVQLFGIGGFAAVEGYLFNVPGQQRQWAGALFGPQIYLRGFGRPDGDAGLLVLRWAPPVDPVALCGMENVEARGYYVFGFIALGASFRYCRSFGPYQSSIEATVEMRMVAD